MIFAVLVLYRMLPEQSTCFRSLTQILATHASMHGLALLLYDNSPSAVKLPAFPIPLIYRHDAMNGGIAAAYNAGLTLAREGGYKWLLLLDQDTALTAEYLLELLATAGDVPIEVSAIVPRLTQDGHTHSPHRLPRVSHEALPKDAYGLLRERISAFNSGAALRVNALDRFPTRYWLDFLDHAVFFEMQSRGGRVWLMRARLEHRLSTQKLGEEASLTRYRNVLQAERDFYREYGSFSDNVYYRLRRVKQTLGHVVKVRDKRFALLSAQAALGLLSPTQKRS